MVTPKTHTRCLASAGLSAVSFVAALLFLPAFAQAAPGEYEVKVCTTEGNALHRGLGFEEQDRSTNFVMGECTVPAAEPAAPPPVPTIAIRTVNGLVSGFAGWTLTAAPGTQITSMTGTRKVKLPGDPIDTKIEWAVTGSGGVMEAFKLQNRTSMELTRQFTWTPPTPAATIVAHLTCTNGGGCPNSGSNGRLLEEEILLTNVVAHVQDNTAPTVSTAGELLDPGPVRGSKEVSFQAGDVGSGVRKVSLLVDGVAKDSKTDSNSGFCQTPYVQMGPCATSFNSAFTLDTAVLADGTHTVEVLVEDASGRTGGASAQIEVHNRPTSSGAPALSGGAKIGGKLTVTNGQWDGHPTTFSYRWLRCPADVGAGQEGSCAPIDGAEGESFAVTGADVGKRLVARVTAANAAGAESAFSVPSDVVPQPPGPEDDGKNGGSGGNSNGGKGGKGKSSVPEGERAAPQTKIVAHPKKRTAQRTAKFRFSSDQPGAKFECRLDRGRFKACRAPFKWKVKPGKHLMRVRAVDKSGAADPTPAVFRWVVVSHK